MAIAIYGQGASVAVGTGVGGCSVAYEPGLYCPGYAVAVKVARRTASAVSMARGCMAPVQRAWRRYPLHLRRGRQPGHARGGGGDDDLRL